MPRAAGNFGAYEYVLRDRATGKYIREETLHFPSVTTVIKASIDKPQLLNWVERTTLEGVAALSSQRTALGLGRDGSLYDALTDADWTGQLLKENRMRWTDVRDEAGDRGHEEHRWLEKLAKLQLAGQEELADEQAREMMDSTNGYTRATAKWWLETTPYVIASEKFVCDLKYGYAGTFDLMIAGEPFPVIVDLKSRADHLGAYESDGIQVSAYMTAMQNKVKDAEFYDGALLIIHPNGEYNYDFIDVNPDIFLHMLAAYKARFPKGGD
jgi:hypothetical protein